MTKDASKLSSLLTVTFISIIDIQARLPPALEEETRAITAMKVSSQCTQCGMESPGGDDTTHDVT